MIAGRHIVVIAAGVIDKAKLEAMGALVLESSNPELLMRHLRHALIDPMPEPRGNSLVDPRPRASRLAPGDK